jgi:glycosyltransferase involved in cell wall biosynthesis
MKVAIYSRLPVDIDSPRGGIETATTALVRALALTEDLDLHVVTLERNRTALGVTSWGKVTVHRLPGSRFPHALDILAGPGRWRLKRYLRRLRPDVVHFHEYHGLCIGSLPMPYVYTMHGFDHENIVAERDRMAWLRAPLWKWIESWGLARQRHVIAIAPYVHRAIRPLTRATIYDICNPLRPEFFDTARREIPGRVFFAGWISPRKNPLGLARAFAAVVSRGVRASLHIAGEEKEPQYARHLRETIIRLGIAGQTTLLGRIGQSAILGELSEASVFVLPSLQENAPMAIAEAMAMGVPVISSNRCGMSDMVRDGETGFLVDPEDCEALADRLAEVLADDARRAQMGQAARSLAESRYHPATVARQVAEVYRCLARHDGTAQ